MYWESSSTLVGLAQKCTTITSLRKARQLHALLLTTTINPGSPFLNNSLISMYGRCSALKDARQVFDRMPLRTLVSYNAAIAAYSRVPSHAISAFELLAEMGFEGFKPSGITFTSLIQASSSIDNNPLLGCWLQAKVIKHGFFNDVCLQTSILGMYSARGDMESAEKAFVCIVDKDAVAWNSMIFGNLKNERNKEGLGIFVQMLMAGTSPTNFTYSMVLNACAKLGDHMLGKLIHGRLICSDTTIDAHVQNALLDMYCSCGDLCTACIIFSRICDPDIVAWNTIISGHSGNGEGEKAVEYFVELRRMSFPDPDEYTFAASISGSGSLLTSESGKSLHCQAVKAGYNNSVYVGSTLISMYLSHGENEAAQHLFDSLPEKDIVLWTEMITAHTKMAVPESALKCFCNLYREAHRVDSFALSGALSACADITILKLSESIHSLAIKMGHADNIAVCGSLIDMYVKNGDLQAAESIFSQVQDPDLKCWNSMLGGYSHHGLADKAFNLFDKILQFGLLPDQVTFLSLLSVCNNCCLVEDGKALWRSLKDFGVKPGPKHYSSMVSLLSRAGLLEEAECLIMISPFYETRLQLWRTLLSSCIEKRNYQLGIHAAEQVLDLDAEDAATLVLVAKIYAGLGKWDRVAETRKKIRGLGTEKDPGVSWIEAEKKVLVFSSGDQSLPYVDETQTEIHRLHQNMIRFKDEEGIDAAAYI